jgi:hypothetical protein
VKSNVSLPAFALNEAGSNLNAPLGSAATLTVSPPPEVEPPAPVGVVELAVVELVLLLSLPPHAASANGASAPTASMIVSFFIKESPFSNPSAHTGGESNADILNGR